MTTDAGTARIAKVELLARGGLDASFALNLEAGVTLLVGKNGAGKSLIVSALHGCLRGVAIGFPTEASFLRAEVVTSRGLTYHYEYDIERRSPDEDTNDPEKRLMPVVTERCWSDEGDIWSVKDGKLVLDGKDLALPKGEGFLAADEAWDHPVGLLLINKFWPTQLVPPGVVRDTMRSISGRQPRVLFGTRKRNRISWQREDDRLGALCLSIAQIFEHGGDDLEELHANLRKLQVKERLQVRKFDMKQDAPDVAALVMLGEEHLGLVSDGTLRMLEIVVATMRHPTAPVFIEEPETGIHPGLLDRLLALLEGYATVRQVVLTTHSPYVVNRFEPAAIRIVERNAGRTSARSLAAQEVENLEAYLSDEGDLDQYLFQLETDEGEDDGDPES